MNFKFQNVFLKKKILLSAETMTSLSKTASKPIAWSLLLLKQYCALFFYQFSIREKKMLTSLCLCIF